MSKLFTKTRGPVAASPIVKPVIPRPYVVNGAYHFLTHQAENFVRQSIGLDPLPDPAPDAPISLMRLAELSQKLGGRNHRTLKREIQRAHGHLIELAEHPSVEPKPAPAKRQRSPRLEAV